MPDKAFIDPKSDMQATNIDSILQEQRKFEPPAEFSKHALVKSLGDYERRLLEMGLRQMNANVARPLPPKAAELLLRENR